MKFTNKQILAFIFGLGATITIRIVGIFAISDAIAILFLPFIFGKKRMFADKHFRNVIILLLLWMFSAIISDFYNDTEQIDSLKGVFGIIPFFACLVFAYWLLKNNFRLMEPFLWGYAISFTVSAGFGLDAFYQEQIARKGMESISSLGYYNKIIIWIISSFISGAFAISYFKKYPYLVTLVLFVFSFITLLEGSRSTFLIFFIASLTLFYILKITKELPWNGFLWQERLGRKIPKFILFASVLVFAGKNIYEYGVTKGYMGDDELQKYKMQAISKIGLLSGRGEFVSAVLAIKDAPILGHGSYAKDKNKYGYSAAVLTGQDDFSINWNFTRGDDIQIPSHSHLWSAWVFNGVMGAVFWFYILFGILLKFIRKRLFSYPKYLAYVLLGIFSLGWNILFSPFSQKPMLAMAIVFFIMLLRKESIILERIKKIND
ncbi:hypothetical protein V8G56_12345 [Gaetbulibacter aquiaggeris]|uniref:O-antigen ligase domain-containing protein n=1 Tax=Gaetbulibacter aquiaggeris TaxID=1735373 RepID=A0ABW7MUZ9_9FLAO